MATVAQWEKAFAVLKAQNAEHAAAVKGALRILNGWSFFATQYPELPVLQKCLAIADFVDGNTKSPFPSHCRSAGETPST